jgi:hypothetical protein
MVDHTNDTPEHTHDSPEQDVGKRLLAALGMLGRKKGTMPLRTFSNIPLFTGHNVNGFLDRYNTVADDFEVQPEERVKGLVYYLQEDGPKNILQFVRTLPEWTSKDWVGMQEVLRRTFPEARERSRYDIDDLRMVINKNRDLLTMKKLSDYYFEYKMIADYLLSVQDITRKEHGALFFRGLPLQTRYALEAREKLRSTQNDGTQQPRVLSLDQVYADCREILKTEGVYSDANTCFEKRTIAPMSTSQSERAVPVTASGHDSGMEALVRLFEEMRVEMTQLR